MERAEKVLSKGIHFSGIVCTGAIGMDNPILIPFCEGTIVHFQVVYLLSGGEFRFNRNKVFFKCFFKFGPCSKVWWGLFYGNLLAITCPFFHWGS